MQMLQCLEKGRVNVSCRLRGTCKHRGCCQAWVGNVERLLTIRDTTSFLKNTKALVAQQLHLHECAELDIRPGAPSKLL